MPRKSPDLNFDEEALREFRGLFTEVRNAHYNAGTKANSEDVAHRAALKYARSKKWDWAEKLVEASLSSRVNPDSAIQILEELVVPKQFSGNVYNILGTAYYNKENFDKAFHWYKQALEAPEYDTPGIARHNLGLTAEMKGDTSQALRWFKEALATPEYDSPGKTHNALGIIYFNKSDFDEAIRWFKEGLETPEGNDLGNIRNNLGASYFNKGDYYEAIGWYKEALNTASFDSRIVRNDLANAYRLTGQIEEAKREAQQVLDDPELKDDHNRAKYILSLIEREEFESSLTPGESELALSSLDPEVEEFKSKLRRNVTSYDEYIDNKPKLARPDELTILRGWSSATPLLDGGRDRTIRGGGYFLTWREKGLVFDPGFDFIDNFHDAGYHSMEIDALIVSHDHADHNADLRRLDDLFYEVHRRDSLKKVTQLGLDADTAKRLEPNKIYRKVKELNWAGASKSDWFGPGEGLPFTIEHFIVEHGTDVQNALGFRIRLLNDLGEVLLTLGYTGDTKFSLQLIDQLKDADILIGHVSQPSLEELDDPEYLKDNHLGLNGMVKLIVGVKPKLVLVGEFWSGIDDLRMDIVKWLRSKTGMREVFPATLGLTVSLPDLHIECGACKKKTHFSNIWIVPKGRYSDFQYVCKSCID